MRFAAFFPALAFLIGGLLWMGTTQPVQAQQQDNLRDIPGYVDFNEVSQWFESPANIEVNLRGTLLNLIANSAGESESEFANLVGNLKAIQVRGFPMTDINQDEVLRHFDDLSRRLEDQGWERIVYIRDEGDNVNIYVKPEGDTIAGLTVMVADPSDQETMFVNIVGSIRPEDIGKIGRGLDIEPLQDVDSSNQNNQ